ncbi:MAG: Rne/Rng family ribonuclease [Rickettsiaceae bacterium]|nr:Rne/Rng family ribonuclease [Rickettsiaceae bacterium]
MSKKILVDGTFPNQCRVVLVNQNNKIEDLEYQSSSISQIKGNIYLAKIVRIEPGLQAAFIDYGSGKNGFLPFSEIHASYYNIPIADIHKTHEHMEGLKAISTPKVVFSAQDEPDSKISKTASQAEINFEEIEELVDQNNLAEEDSKLDDDYTDEFPAPTHLYKQYQIQEVIKKNQVILVQALKEERGNKGASFTSYISLAGKYCVLMPNSPGHQGISRKIQSPDERRRLKYLISQLMTEDDLKVASVIVRTAGMKRPAGEIKKDYEYLVNLWNNIRAITLQSMAPSLIHVEEEIIQKTIRDMYDPSVSEIIIEGQEAYQSAIDFMSEILPEDISKTVLYDKVTPIFSCYNIEDQIADLYKQAVNLPSGGYIIINPTEALTAIDVNSGKSISERSIEETAMKTNLEAAKEIAYQLKIRDISGLIVIDFIDMNEIRNRKIVERSMRELLSRDKARVQMNHISPFGLLEVSRQRLRPSFLESHTKMCSNCNGKGIVRDEEANSMVILRTIENEIRESDLDIMNIFASINIVLYILNNKRAEIEMIESKHGIKLNFMHDHQSSSDSFSIEKVLLSSLEDQHILEEASMFNNDNGTEQTKLQNKKSSPVKNNKKIKAPDLVDKIDKQAEEGSNHVEAYTENTIQKTPQEEPRRKQKKKPIQNRRNWKDNGLIESLDKKKDIAENSDKPLNHPEKNQNQKLDNNNNNNNNTTEIENPIATDSIEQKNDEVIQAKPKRRRQGPRRHKKPQANSQESNKQSDNLNDAENSNF